MISDCLHYWECVANYLRLIYKEGVWIWLFLCNFQWYFLQVCSVEKARIASQWLRPSLNINNSLSPAECWKEILSHGLTQKKYFVKITLQNIFGKNFAFTKFFYQLLWRNFCQRIVGDNETIIQQHVATVQTVWKIEKTLTKNISSNQLPI